MLSVRHVSAALLSLVLLGSSAYAEQSGAGTGAVDGGVLDADHKAVPGATITLTDELTGYVRTAISDRDGRFATPALPVGRYTLEASLPGFAPFKQPGLRV